jgi:hypothetical protein
MPGIRVTDAFLNQPSVNGPFNLELDLVGVSQGSQPVDKDAATFALVAGIFAAGKQLFYLPEEQKMSSDPYFGKHPNADAGNVFKKPYKVLDADVIWDFKHKKGQLLLQLQNRSLALVDVSNAGAALGWLLNVRTGRVRFDGQLHLPREIGSVP